MDEGILEAATRPRARILWAYVLAAICVVSAGASQQQESPQEALERAQQAVALLEKQIARDPSDPQLWQGMLMSRAVLANVEDYAAAREQSPEEREARQRRISEQIFDEWIEARPGDPVPLLHRVMLQQPATPEEQLQAVIELNARYPGSLPVTERLASMFDYRGMQAEAEAAWQTFIAHSPDEPHAHARLYEIYERRGDEERAGEALAQWLAVAPNDVAPNAAWYQRRTEGLSPAERTVVAREVTSRLAGEDLAQWCSRIENQHENDRDHVLACYQRALEEADPEEEAYQYTLSNYGALLGKLGEFDRMARVLAPLPVERRFSAASRVASDLIRRRECQRASAVLLGALGEVPENYQPAISSYELCLHEPGFQQLVLESLARDGSMLKQSVSMLLGYVPPERIEAVLVARLRSGSDELPTQVFEALDTLYASQGLHEKQRALLGDWLKARPRDTGVAVRLADWLVMDGDVGAALEVLTTSTHESSESVSLELNQRLIGLYLETDQPDEARGVAARAIQSEARDAHWGHLLLARLELSLERMDEAFAAYEEFFREAPAHAWKEAGEYVGLLVLHGEATRLIAHLEGEWDRHADEGRRLAGHRDEWLARRLEEVGFFEEALTLLERRVPELETVALWRTIGRLATAAGQWDRAQKAHEAMLRLAPNDVSSWTARARLEIERGRPELAFPILDQVFDAFEAPGLGPWFAWTDAVLATSESRPLPSSTAILEAIEVLRESTNAFEQQEYPKYAIHERMRSLYTLLADVEDEVVGAGADPPP